MASVLRFLSVPDVLTIHEDTIRQEGGLAGVRDLDLLVSAVMMPQQQFGGSYLHEGIAAMAAAYLYHICQNHAFYDGNKRTAALSTLVFLDANGVTSLPEPEELERVTLSVAAGEMDKSKLTEWMRRALKE